MVYQKNKMGSNQTFQTNKKTTNDGGGGGGEGENYKKSFIKNITTVIN